MRHSVDKKIQFLLKIYLKFSYSFKNKTIRMFILNVIKREGKVGLKQGKGH